MTDQHLHPGRRPLHEVYCPLGGPSILFATHADHNGHVRVVCFGDLNFDGTAGLHGRVVQPGPIIQLPKLQTN